MQNRALACLALTWLIATTAQAATSVNGFNVSVTRGNVEARVVWSTSESALFYFDHRDSPEVLVKVLDGCAFNGHLWVFVAAATDLQLVVRVTSPSGSVWESRLFEGHPSQSRGDTQAFPCRGAFRTTTWLPGDATEPERVAANVTLRNRFGAEIHFTHPDGSGYARTAWSSDSAALFFFFSRSNAEVLFRVQDGCAVNGHWWVFMAAVSDLRIEATVRDSETGAAKVYRLEGDTLDGIADRQAFPCDAGNSPDPGPNPQPDPDPDPKPPGPDPAPDHTATSVTLNDRFAVQVEFTVAGARRDARVVDVDLPGDASALFHFGSPDNAEVLLKVLNGCAINRQWWVFAAAATDVAYTITVRDSATDAVRVYFAEAGGSPPLADTYGFPCS